MRSVGQTSHLIRILLAPFRVSILKQVGITFSDLESIRADGLTKLLDGLLQQCFNLQARADLLCNVEPMGHSSDCFIKHPRLELLNLPSEQFHFDLCNKQWRCVIAA